MRVQNFQDAVTNYVRALREEPAMAGNSSRDVAIARSKYRNGRQEARSLNRQGGTSSVYAARRWALSTACANPAARKPTAWWRASATALVEWSTSRDSRQGPNWRQLSRVIQKRTTSKCRSVRSTTFHPFRRLRNGRLKSLNCSSSGSITNRDLTSKFTPDNVGATLAYHAICHTNTNQRVCL
jgi:hypothetical protein